MSPPKKTKTPTWGKRNPRQVCNPQIISKINMGYSPTLNPLGPQPLIFLPQKHSKNIIQRTKIQKSSSMLSAGLEKLKNPGIKRQPKNRRTKNRQPENHRTKNGSQKFTGPTSAARKSPDQKRQPKNHRTKNRQPESSADKKKKTSVSHQLYRSPL